MRDGLYVKRFMKRIQSDFVVDLIERTIDVATGTNAAELLTDGFCIKCLKEAGVQAVELLSMPIQIRCSMQAIRAAGYRAEQLSIAFPEARGHYQW